VQVIIFSVDRIFPLPAFFPLLLFLGGQKKSPLPERTLPDYVIQAGVWYGREKKASQFPALRAVAKACLSADRAFAAGDR
jgi:hypothetical protein